MKNEEGCCKSEGNEQIRCCIMNKEEMKMECKGNSKDEQRSAQDTE